METTSHEFATFKWCCKWHIHQKELSPAHEHRDCSSSQRWKFQHLFIGHLLRGRSWAWHLWTHLEKRSSPSEPVCGHSSTGQWLILICETNDENDKDLSTPIRELLLVWNGKPVQNAGFPLLNDIRFFLQSNFFFFTLKHQEVPWRVAGFLDSRDGLGTGQRQQTAMLLGCWYPLALEKDMATHSSVHAWNILWTEDPGGLQCLGVQSPTRLSDYTTTTTLWHFPWLFSVPQLSTGNPVSLLLMPEEVLWNGCSTFIKRKKSPWSTLWQMCSQMCS